MSRLRLFVVAAVCLSVAWVPAGVAAQEAEPAPSSVSASEIGPFMGYWMLQTKFGENDVRMGLIIDRAEDDSGGAAATVVSSFFGELHADTLRRDGEGLIFDINAAFGQITVEARIAGKNAIEGHLADDQGRLSADFTGELSDRQAFLLFTTPENETRITKGDQLVRLRFARPPAGERDFEQIGSLAAGEVVRFLEHPVIKLTTDLELAFGDVRVTTENVTDDYPGVYGVWLKRTDDGWSMVLNAKADVWGTQYDPDVEHLEVPLTKGTTDEASETLVAKMEEGESGATLQFTWGEHTWSAPFAVVAE